MGKADLAPSAQRRGWCECGHHRGEHGPMAGDEDHMLDLWGACTVCGCGDYRFTPKVDRAKAWRGRVRFWRFFAIPVSVLVFAIACALAGGMASTGDPFLILLAVFVAASGARSLWSSVEGLRFAADVLRTHELFAEPQATPKDPSRVGDQETPR